MVVGDRGVLGCAGVETTGLAGCSFRQVDSLAAGPQLAGPTRVSEAITGRDTTRTDDSQGACKSGV